MGNQNSPPYLYQNFDITAFMATPLCTDPVIARMRNTLTEGLNNKIRLPRLIFLVLDESMKITHLGGEKPLRWLYSEISRVIQSKKDMLLPRCVIQGQPEVTTLKPVPRSLDPRKHHKEDKRNVHKLVDKIVRGSNLFDAMNVNSILPTDMSYYQENCDLTVCSHITYWNFVNIAMRDRNFGINNNVFTNKRSQQQNTRQ